MSEKREILTKKEFELLNEKVRDIMSFCEDKNLSSLLIIDAETQGEGGSIDNNVINGGSMDERSLGELGYKMGFAICNSGKKGKDSALKALELRKNIAALCDSILNCYNKIRQPRPVNKRGSRIL